MPSSKPSHDTTILHPRMYARIHDGNTLATSFGSKKFLHRGNDYTIKTCRHVSKRLCSGAVNEQSAVSEKVKCWGTRFIGSISNIY